MKFKTGAWLVGAGIISAGIVVSFVFALNYLNDRQMLHEESVQVIRGENGACLIRRTSSFQKTTVPEGDIIRFLPGKEYVCRNGRLESVEVLPPHPLVCAMACPR